MTKRGRRDEIAAQRRQSRSLMSPGRNDRGGKGGDCGTKATTQEPDVAWPQ